MKGINLIAICLFFVIMPLTDAFAQSWLCENESLKRTVNIHYPNSPSYTPCAVIYRKLTEDVKDRVLWQAQNNEGYCENKAESFVQKLESWGWRCSENASVAENRSLNTPPASASFSPAALGKKLLNAVKLDENEHASSMRFDKYINVLGEFDKSNHISDEPDGYISKFHAYYLLNAQAEFMGQKVIVLTEPSEDGLRKACCSNKKFSIYFETVGDTQPLRDFAESNNCYFKDNYIWPFGGMYFSSGHYAVLHCHAD